MAGLNLDEVVKEAIELLPPKGEKVEFDVYKDKLYAQFPESGQAAFAHMIKREIINKEMGRSVDGKPVVMLSRKA